jgi:hypothetical protein
MDEQMKVSIGAQLDGLLRGLKEATGAVREATTEMKEHFETLNQTVRSVQNIFMGLSLALAGGEAFEGMIEKTAELGVELEKASQKTGIEVERLSALKFAADQSHVSFEEFSTAVQRFSRNVFEAGAGSTKAGDALAALHIRTRNANGELRPLEDMLLDVAEKFHGMEDGAGKTAIAMELFGRGGATLIPMLNQGRAGIEQLTDRARELGVTMSEDGVRAAVEYEDKMKELRAEGNALERDFALKLIPTLKSLADQFVEWGKSGGVIDRVTEAFRVGLNRELAITTSLLSAVAAAGAAVSGNWAQLAVEIEHIKATMDGSFGGARLPLGAGREYDEPAKKKAAPALPNREAAKKEAAERKKEFEVYLEGLKTQEVAARDSAAERVRIVEEETAITEEFFGRQSTEFEKAMQHELEVKREVAEAERKADLKSVTDIFGVLKLIGEEHARQLKKMEEGWNKVFEPVTATFDKMITGILQGTQTLSTAFHNLWADFLLGSINAGLKSLAAHEAHELAKKNITASSVVERVALETWGALQTVAVNAWAALTSIANYAWTAVAATWAAISAIPVVGPFLAPALAIGAGAELLSLAGNIKSAAGGFDIPSGMNPFTQLHSQEMVLPAELANKIRGMTDGGGETHIHIHAVDAQSVERLLMDHSNGVANSLVKAVKDNHTGLRKAFR